jgi:site-specific DNA-cytosine methylase
MRLLELFCGTGSIGKAFKKQGWEVISLDLNPKAEATITTDILAWDYTVFKKGHFDFVWTSPPCTEYSVARTTAKTPRNFELADSIVARTLEIIGHLEPKAWLMENPASGYLKTREVVQGLPWRDVTYCR